MDERKESRNASRFVYPMVGVLVSECMVWKRCEMWFEKKERRRCEMRSISRLKAGRPRMSFLFRGWAVAHLGIVVVAGMIASGCSRSDPEALYQKFREPAAETRPFVRWWWNGNRVNAAEIEREIELLHQAGIGGFEINTIGMEKSVKDPDIDRHPALEWLSPEWIEMIRVACEAARERNMTADLIVGSGWPFGAEFLETEEQTQRLALVKKMLTGPRVFEANVNDPEYAKPPIQDFSGEKPAEHEPAEYRLQFLRLLPAEALKGEFNEGLDLLPIVAEDGSFKVELPEGSHILYVGTWQAGFTHVKHSAPGAGGPVVNHLDAAAVRRYLDAMSDVLNSSLRGGMRRAIRATFVDSLELDHANWTGDFPQEFERRRGYKLAPYLPFVLDAFDPDVESAFSDTILRVRYDFYRTLTDLFEERFISTYTQWAADNGLKARIQAYGREAHPLHGSMTPHLPEGETWLWNGEQDESRIRVESTVANKYVASGANLVGQRVRSFEAMTNAVPVFRATLENFKEGMDRSVLSGVNHPILHGFNYSPPDAGYPGWVKFGSWLHEENPWWPHLPLFAEYAARLGTVMRHSEAQASIAVLAPRPEEWAYHGLLYQPFPEVHFPWYQYRLIEAIHQAGYNADYVSERILESATFNQGKLNFGSRFYQAIVLEGVAAMSPEAAEVLAGFAESGGAVIIVGEPACRAPGLHERADRDARVAAAMRRILAAGEAGDATVVAVDPPVQGGLLEWAHWVLGQTRLVPDVRLDIPLPHFSQVYHRDGDTAIYFLSNTSTSQPAEVTAAFIAGVGAAWDWDLHSGEREKIALGANNSLELRLEPLESKLVVFDPNDEPLLVDGTREGFTPIRDLRPIALNGPWQVEFRAAGTGKVFMREFSNLVDLSQLEDDRAVADFGGTLVYRMTFDRPEGEVVRIDLGHVNGTTEVRLNGKSLGVQWWGRRVFPIHDKLRPGENTIEVEVTTVVANQMRSMQDNSVAQRFAWWAPPIEMGLIDPVRLLRE